MSRAQRNGANFLKQKLKVKGTSGGVGHISGICNLKDFTE